MTFSKSIQNASFFYRNSLENFLSLENSQMVKRSSNKDTSMRYTDDSSFEQEEAFVVEKIIAKRIEKGITQYYIKWKGYKR